jgi:hypothetical protein
MSKKHKGLAILVQHKNTLTTYPVICTFPIPRIGWEMDNEGYIVQFDETRRRLVMTSHGTPYFAEESELTDQIKELEATIEEMTVACDLITM